MIAISKRTVWLVATLLWGSCKSTPTAVTDGGPAVIPPLGAHWSDSGDLSFGVRSLNATHVEAWLYDAPRGAEAKFHFELAKQGTSDEWAGTISAETLSKSGLSSATLTYGYRAWGPNWLFDPAWAPGTSTGYVSEVDSHGNRFNPNKLLVDPYALELSHDPYQKGMADGAVYGAHGNDRNKDSGRDATKAFALKPMAFDFGEHPDRPLTDDVIYEVHLRGLTAADSALDCAGTYKAAAARAATLHSLDVTAIELLPVQETQNDDNPKNAPGNYWGYSTLGFLAPDRHYSCDTSPGGPTREFAQMVKAFHEVGIKVFLDVVYNHTAETGSSAVLSLRGLDNISYYELDATKQGYTDNTGLGGNINAASPLTRDLVLASLHHWVDDLGVDGFRFDLAAVLGNRCAEKCFSFAPGDPASVLNRAAAELPKTALIAEPWGIGDGTYQLGHFPAAWAGWNDQFRDSIRRAQNKLGFDAVAPGTLANDLSGSPNLFPGLSPASSVNFLVSHDGFSLHDLYSCNEKKDDQPWPYGPSSGGTDDNLSWDQGGDAAAQLQAVRTSMAILMLSAGVPMMTGGDEYGRSVNCNNNAYNIDSVANWLDPSAGVTHADQVSYFQHLLAFRKAHPTLRPSHFRDGSDHNANGVKDETWFTAAGVEASSEYLSNTSNRFIGLLLDGTEFNDPSPALYVAYNESDQSTSVVLPAVPAGHIWARAADTGGTAELANFAALGAESPWPSTTYPMKPRSVVVFLEH